VSPATGLRRWGGEQSKRPLLLLPCLKGLVGWSRQAGVLTPTPIHPSILNIKERDGQPGVLTPTESALKDLPPSGKFGDLLFDKETGLPL